MHDYAMIDIVDDIGIEIPHGIGIEVPHGAGVGLPDAAAIDIIDDVLRWRAMGYDADTIAERIPEHSAFVYSLILTLEDLEDLALEAELACREAARKPGHADFLNHLPPQAAA